MSHEVISEIQLRSALKSFHGRPFSTLDFVDEVKKKLPSIWGNLENNYGAGGKKAGKYFTANSALAQILLFYSNRGVLCKLTYMPASKLWGSPVIRYWVETPGQKRIGADVFISYSQKRRTLTKNLAADLKDEEYAVWWDRKLFAGDQFEPTIFAELDAAWAVIVIWTPESVVSRWVLKEADRACENRKFIPVRVKELDPKDIPIRFRAIHTELLTQRAAIFNALENLRKAR